MTKGTDTVVELPLLGRLTFNEGHGMILGLLASVTPITALLGAPQSVVGLLLMFDLLAVIARFDGDVPVLSEAWYFLVALKIPVLAAVIAA